MKNKILLFIVSIYLLRSLVYTSNPRIHDRSTELIFLQGILNFKKSIEPEKLSNKDQIAWSYLIRLQNRLFDLWAYQNGANIHLNNTISHCHLLFNKGTSITSTENPQINNALQETIEFSKKLILQHSK
jgi:hypothetical protein